MDYYDKDKSESTKNFIVGAVAVILVLIYLFIVS